MYVLCRFRGVRRKVPGASRGGLIWRREIEEDLPWQQHNKMSLNFSMKDIEKKRKKEAQHAMSIEFRPQMAGSVFLRHQRLPKSFQLGATL